MPSERIAWQAAQASYALFAAAPLCGVTPFIGLIVAYTARDVAGDTWIATHLRWLRRTFWFTMLWLLVGGVTILLGIGVIILVAAAIWFVYRVARGWMRLSMGQSV